MLLAAPGAFAAALGLRAERQMFRAFHFRFRIVAAGIVFLARAQYRIARPVLGPPLGAECVDAFGAVTGARDLEYAIHLDLHPLILADRVLVKPQRFLGAKQAEPRVRRHLARPRD